ncbi:MAG: NUDIX hydrolase [Phycisphaerales bacterium]|nr:MAG: NUDIX hydrolase [Phycisphaerales bacterium]
MLRRWKRVETAVFCENRWWAYNVDKFQIPDGLSGEYHYVHTNGSSMVIPVTNDGKMVLVNQFRYLGDRESLEFPCGSVEKGHSHLQTALLELEQEAGYRADEIREIGRFNPYNGVTDEFCAVFVADRLRSATAKPDVTEEFELVYCTARQLDDMVRDKVIWDGMTLAAWMLARHEVL